jgi:photosystem II stability/assembly factor-like uncharacterized protein
MRFFFFSILFFHLSLNIQSQEWINLAPLRLNTDVQGVDFINESTGVMCLATEGVIFKTTDSGTTWRQLWTPAITGNLYDVVYASPDTLFTAGSNGDFFRSIDGGTTWVSLETNSLQTIFDLFFITNNLGFAAGNLGSLLRTTDAGATWTSLATGVTGRITDVFFVDGVIGFAVGFGGALLKTEDAGLTWAPLNLGATTNLASVHFTSTTTGFVSGAGNAIYRTTNGGTSWTLQTANVNMSSLNHIEFRNSQVGWAVGTMGAYYSTTNGGNTWTINSPLGNFDLYEGQYVGPSNTIIVGRSRIYRSTNNAASFTLIKSGTPNSNLSSVQFFNDLTGTIVGNGSGSSNQSAIIQTTDGGQTWETRQSSVGGGYYDMHFPTSQIGYAVGGTLMAKTTNGGANWTISTPFTGSFAGTTWFTSANTGFVGRTIANIGISKTTDGGTTFTSTPNFPVDEIFFLNANSGWASSGGNNVLYRTTDGGANWTYWETPGTLGGNVILFLDEQIGWVGSQGLVNRTTDGGLTWSTTFVSGLVTGMKFSSPLNGYCVTNDGALYRTIDGGATWTVLIDISNTVGGNLAAFFTDNYCYAVSSGGTVLRAELGCGDLAIGNFTGTSNWCENVVGQLSISPIPNAVSYSWSFPEGWQWDTENQSFFVQPIPSATSGIATVTVTNECGEQATAQIALNVTPQVSPLQLASTDFSFCFGEEAIITLPPDANADEFNWQLAGGLQGEINENVMTVNTQQATSAGLAFVSTSNACGTSEIITLSVNVAEPIVISWPLPQTTFCTGGIYPIDFAQPAGGVYSGVNVSNGLFTTFSIAEGSYPLSYTYTNAQGCEASLTIEVMVLSGNTPSLSIIGDNFVCTGQQATYALSSTEDIANVEWSFPAGWNAIQVNNQLIVQTFGMSGNVTVSYSSLCLSESTSLSTFIQTGGLNVQTPNFTLSEAQWCADSSAFISFSPLVSYSSTDGLSLTQDNPSTWRLSGLPGPHTLLLWQESICAISDTAVVELFINAPPNIVLTSPTTMCSGAVLPLTASPPGGLFTGSFVLDGQLQPENFVGSTQLNYTYADPFTGCSSNIDFMVEVVNDAPSLESLVGSSPTCLGGSVVFTATVSPNDAAFVWIVPNSWPSGTSANTYSYSAPVGSHSVGVYALGLCSNSDTLFASATIAPDPEVFLSLPNDTLCLDQFYPFTFNPSDGIFSGAGVDNFGVNTDGINIGIQNYTYTIFSGTECEATAEVSVTVEACLSSSEKETTDWSLYPNPTSDLLFLQKSAEPGSYSVAVYSSTGAMVALEENSPQQINLASCSSGLYLIHIQHGERLISFRVIKE